MICNLQTNLIELNKANPSNFSSDLIINYSDYIQEHKIAFLPNQDLTIEDVPLNKVVGIDQCYDSFRWDSCLLKLKRIKRNLQHLEDNPSYYQSDIGKSDMSFKQFEGKYFIESGKHRTVIARFLEHFNPTAFVHRSALRGVRIRNYKLDYEFMKWRAEINELRNKYLYLNFYLYHQPNDLEVSLTIVNTERSRGSEVYARSELPSCIKALQRPSLMARLGGERTHQLIRIRDCVAG